MNAQNRTSSVALAVLSIILASCRGQDDVAGDAGSIDAQSPLDGSYVGSDSGARDSAAGQADSSMAPDSPFEIGSDDSPSSADAGVDVATVTSADGFGPSRAACINKINALRATASLAPYTLENTVATNTCVDTQASNDQTKNSANYSFENSAPSCTWGSPTSSEQNECQSGYGTTPAGIEQCLEEMWSVSTMPHCQGCIGCTAPGGACPNCDYSGTMGYACGNYVNLSAPYFTMVACGFGGAAPSSSTGWAVQNFE